MLMPPETVRTGELTLVLVDPVKLYLGSRPLRRDQYTMLSQARYTLSLDTWNLLVMNSGMV